MLSPTSKSLVRVPRAALCLAASFILTGACSYAQTLTVTPATALVDQPVAITASGLEPGEVVTVRADLDDAADHGWSAEAKFAADSGGKLDLTQDAPLKGSYHGVSAMGLVWSMQPTGEARIYQPPRDLGPQTIRFTLHSKAGSAKAQLEQIILLPGTRILELKGALHGAVFLPPDTAPMPGQLAATSPQRRPALLVVGGSEGGTPLRRAAWLANHGYVTLALAYFAVPGLPQELRNIPLEYFGEAISWLSQRPDVDPARLGVVGTSRGGELALQLGSMYPALHAVVAFVPANVRVQACCDGYGGGAWTWRGHELAYAMGSFNGMAKNEAAQIRVELTHGPILVVSGQSDGVWPSSQMTAMVVSRLKSAHFKYEVERLDYPNAGHRAGDPEIIPAWLGELRHPISGRPMDLGGTPSGNAASGLDAGPRILAFLAQALGSPSAAAAAAPAP
ncbi:MAG TPA: acyl-CoA thioesterase/bile acid-CoA:amino acid N-acyltransferase family protein [Candidatus Aquilonibacter sp.]|nr:acyl-CoA thioesterase/bile acid-CoA:amino acid N-acyltransferase family protein [Candidatus Aquilonibacter sp.]